MQETAAHNFHPLVSRSPFAYSHPAIWQGIQISRRFATIVRSDSRRDRDLRLPRDRGTEGFPPIRLKSRGARRAQRGRLCVPTLSLPAWARWGLPKRWHVFCSSPDQCVRPPRVVRAF
jgi:hypothetical protein